MRSWLPVLSWCAATLAAIALASFAMLPVLRTAAPDEGTLVSADQARGSAPLPLPSVPLPSRTPTTAPPDDPAPTSASPSKSRSSSRPPSSRPATSAPARRTTEPAQESTVEDGWTVTTNGDGEKTYVRSYRVEGGQTVIQMTEDKVKLLTATPAEGYEVATVQNEPDNLAVYFTRFNHSFVVHALWHNDKPFVQISETGA